MRVSRETAAWRVRHGDDFAAEVTPVGGPDVPAQPGWRGSFDMCGTSSYSISRPSSQAMATW